MKLWELDEAIGALYERYTTEQEEAPPPLSTTRQLGDLSRVLNFLTGKDEPDDPVDQLVKDLVKSSAQVCTHSAKQRKKQRKLERLRESQIQASERIFPFSEPELGGANDSSSNYWTTIYGGGYTTGGGQEAKEDRVLRSQSTALNAPKKSKATSLKIRHTRTKSGPPTRKARQPLVAEPKAVRDAELMRTLISSFPEELAQLTLPQQIDDSPSSSDLPASTSPPNSTGTHVFVDFSNIVIGFRENLDPILQKCQAQLLSEQSPSAPSSLNMSPRLSFQNLALILERNRLVRNRVLAGSKWSSAVTDAETLGYECNILDRVYKPNKKEPSRGLSLMEQAVDEILQLKMAHSIIDAIVNDLQPGTMVLATGDGAPAEYSDGFRKMVSRALSCGWRVELVAWRKSLNYGYRKLRNRWSDNFRIIELDPFAEMLIDGP